MVAAQDRSCQTGPARETPWGRSEIVLYDALRAVNLASNLRTGITATHAKKRAHSPLLEAVRGLRFPTPSQGIDGLL